MFEGALVTGHHAPRAQVVVITWRRVLLARSLANQRQALVNMDP